MVEWPVKLAVYPGLVTAVIRQYSTMLVVFCQVFQIVMQFNNCNIFLLTINDSTGE